MTVRLRRASIFAGALAVLATGAWGQTYPLPANVDVSNLHAQRAVVGSPIQYAASAAVVNSGYGIFAVGTMSDYVPGVDVISPVGGTGTAPTYLVTNTQVSTATAFADGTGGTTSTSTTLSAAVVVGQTAVPVASIAGFASGNTVDVALDGGGYFETTISGAPSGGTITLAAGMPGSAAAGNAVYKAQTVTGTTGTGTKFTASVGIASGGISQVLQIAGGNYTANPTGCAGTSCNEPVTGAGLTGAILTINTGALTLSQQTAGSLTVLPGNIQGVATSSTGSGVGAIITVTSVNGPGSINPTSYYLNGVPANISITLSPITVNCNALGDTAITFVPPAAAYRISALTLVAETGTFTTAKYGLYTGASQGGNTIIPQTVLSGLSTTSTDTNGSLELVNASFGKMTVSTLYFNIGTAQGGTCTLNAYVSLLGLAGG